MSTPNTSITHWNSQLLGKFTLTGLKTWFKQPAAAPQVEVDEPVLNPVELQLQEIAQALAKRVCTPTITQLQRHYNLSQKQAKFYLAQLAERGLLEHNAQTGRYRLSTSNAELQVGFNRFVKRFGEEVV